MRGANLIILEFLVKKRYNLRLSPEGVCPTTFSLTTERLFVRIEYLVFYENI